MGRRWFTWTWEQRIGFAKLVLIFNTLTIFLCWIVLVVRAQPGVDQPYDPDAKPPDFLPGYSNPERFGKDEQWFGTFELSDAAALKVHVQRVRPAIAKWEKESWTQLGWV